MRISHEEEKVTKVEVVDNILCNCCGQEIKRGRDGMQLEDCIHISHRFGYLSDKEGEIHNLDLCESCYDMIATMCKIKPHIENQTELLY